MQGACEPQELRAFPASFVAHVPHIHRLEYGVGSNHLCKTCLHQMLLQTPATAQHPMCGPGDIPGDPIHQPVDTSTHTAVLLVIPPPQLLLQADQLPSCQRTAWLQAAASPLQALPNDKARNTSLKLLLLGELLAARANEDASRSVTASPKRTGACCCSAVALLLQGMSDQSVALQS